MKKVLLLVIALVLVGFAGYVVSTIPVYPAFEKEVTSYETVQQEMAEQDIFAPSEENLLFEMQEYHIRMDGRFRDAQPVGYHVEGIEKRGGRTYCYTFTVTPEGESRAHDAVRCTQRTVEGYVYTTVEWSQDALNYILIATYEDTYAVEANEYMEQQLMDMAVRIQGEHGVPAGEYRQLPHEMTQWHEEDENGFIHGPASVLRDTGEYCEQYLLTQDEYRQIFREGADPDAVLAERSEWYQIDLPTTPPELLDPPEPVITSGPHEAPGVTEIFTYGDYGLELRVSNVRQRRTETCYEVDGVDRDHLRILSKWEMEVFTVYPEAEITVVNAGMVWSETEGKMVATLGFYAPVGGMTVRLEDGLEPLPIAGEIYGLGRENILVLQFEVYEE